MVFYFVKRYSRRLYDYFVEQQYSPQYADPIWAQYPFDKQLNSSSIKNLLYALALSVSHLHSQNSISIQVVFNWFRKNLMLLLDEIFK